VPDVESIRNWLLDRLSEELGLDPSDLDPTESFKSFGLSSREAVGISGDLEDWLDTELSPTILYEYPTIERLAAQLADDEESPPDIEVAKPQEEQQQHFAPEPIAIIGMSCRFPQSPSPEAYWELLHDGVDAITEVPKDRFDIDEYFHPEPGEPGKMYTRWGGFIENVSEFDAKFFGISPREAERMDPQQRLLLEVTWEALERAGIPPTSLAGSNTGTFVGITMDDYLHFQIQDPAQVNAYTATGTNHSIAANRLAYFLDLRGPSMAINTACSSSLVALHTACQNLIGRDCNIAIAGGANLILLPEVLIGLCQARMMAKDGRCKTFDERADGYVRGEGCGVLVLKRLSDAERDGDNVLAVVRGTAVNQDGRTNGLTAPNGLAQQALIQSALRKAGLLASDISYIEAHGTGTELGDPIELEALKAVLDDGRDPDATCLVGSAKSSIGHLESAAGMAGIIKVILAMQHDEIPGNLHFHTLNPKVSLDNSALAIAARRQSWPECNGPRYAGVSSFGFGGTNAHVILEDIKKPPANIRESDAVADRPYHILTLAAQDEPALRTLASDHAEFLRANAEQTLADICFSANTNRAPLKERIAVVGQSHTGIADTLAAYAQGKQAVGLFRGRIQSGVTPKVAFLFAGQGFPLPNMGKDLYESNAVFRQALERCDKALRPLLEPPLLELLYPEDGDASLLERTSHMQPVMFALGYALAELWKSWNITPDAVLGHSVGEFPAACVAGLFSVETGLSMVAERGALMQALPDEGAMLNTSASLKMLEELVAPHAEKVSIAVHNGPLNRVLSGDTETLKALATQLESAGEETKLLRVARAFHSPLMESVLEPFREKLDGISCDPLQIKFMSTVTAEFVDAGEPIENNYWVDHIRRPVLFAQSAKKLADAGYTCFLEMGPVPFLSQMGKQCAENDDTTWVPSLKKRGNDWQTMLEALGALYVRGVDVDWKAFEEGHTRQRVQLPTYPFERKRHWFQPSERLRIPSPPKAHSFSDDWFYRIQWQAWEPQDAVPSSGTLYLIIAEAFEDGKALQSGLIALGMRAFLASPGDTFAKQGPDQFQLDLSSNDDVARVLDDSISKEDAPAAKIIYLAAQESSDSIPTQVAEARCRNASVLLRAVATSPYRHAPRVWFITRRGRTIDENEHTEASQSALCGLGRSASVEHPEIWGGMIDLDSDTTPPCESLIAIMNNTQNEDQVALRYGQLSVARLRRFPLKGAAPSTIACAADGTYLVTGGLGGLGLEIAQWLTRRGAKHLVLIGRTPLPKRGSWATLDEKHRFYRATQSIASMEASGVAVQTAAVDCADASQLDSLMTSLNEKSCPPIRGVIHAAGVVEPNEIANFDPAVLQRVLSAKVNGGWNLSVALEASPLDFFVFCSSAASVIGSPNFTAYAAANAFLDGLAQELQSRDIPAQSINWGPWADVGMAASLDVSDAPNVRAFPPIAPAEGIRALEAVIASGSHQVTILDADWKYASDLFATFDGAHLFQDLTNGEAAEPTATPLPDANEATRFRSLDADSRRSFLREFLKDRIAIALGIPPEEISTNTQLFDLGLDSIMAAELTENLHQLLGIRLYLREILRDPTIEAVVKYLMEELANDTVITNEGEAAIKQPTSVPTPNTPRNGNADPNALDPSMELVVEIQKGTTWPPFFCVAPAGGDSMAYYALAHHMGRDQTVYGLLDPAADGKRKPCRTIEEMAESNIQRIKSIQPEGPYYLGGWSLGGVVAYEVGRQLVESGSEVGLVALLDARRIEKQKVSTPKQLYQNLCFQATVFGSALKVIADSIHVYAATKLKRRKANPEKATVIGRAGNLWHEGIYNLFLKRADMTEILAENQKILDFDKVQVRQFMRIFSANFRALDRFTLRPVKQRLVLYKASIAPPNARETKKSGHGPGWAELVTDEFFTVVDVEGDHFKIVRNPWVKPIGEHIRSIMDEDKIES
jgi:acyl transferase domain-containing protein/thioesterase domain-containing protein/acyl carrier protein